MAHAAAEHDKPHAYATRLGVAAAAVHRVAALRAGGAQVARAESHPATSRVTSGLPHLLSHGAPCPPRFRCRINCTEYPDSCINEQLYMAMADKMVSDGYLAAGYDRVNIGAHAPRVHGYQGRA